MEAVVEGFGALASCSESLGLVLGVLSPQLGRRAAPAAVRLDRRAARRRRTSRGRAQAGGAQARCQRRRHGHETPHRLSVFRAGQRLCGMATVEVAAPLARSHCRRSSARAGAQARARCRTCARARGCGGHGAAEVGAASSLGGRGTAGGGGESVAHCGGQRRRGGGVARGGKRGRDREGDRARVHAAQSRGVVAARGASTGRREGGVDVSTCPDPALDALAGGGARELRGAHPAPQRASPAELSGAPQLTSTAANGTGGGRLARRHAAVRAPRSRRRGGLGGPGRRGWVCRLWSGRSGVGALA